MIDLARGFALLFAVWRTLRARAFVPMLLTLGFAYVAVLEVILGFGARDHGSVPPTFLIVLIFLGPSGLPRLPHLGPLGGWPLASFVARHGEMVHLVVATCASACTYQLGRRSRDLRPETEVARAIDGAGTQLVLVAVLELLLLVIGQLMAYLESS